jgi:hypothetical protein
MADLTGEVGSEALRLDFDRRLMLEFRGSAITSDAGLLPDRQLDDAAGLTDTGGDGLPDARTGKSGRHRLVGRRSWYFSCFSAAHRQSPSDTCIFVELCTHPLPVLIIASN